MTDTVRTVRTPKVERIRINGSDRFQFQLVVSVILYTMEESAAANTNNKRFRKDKPWDHEGIDHWKVDPVDAEENRLPAPIVESSFATLFPKYREKYIREVILSYRCIIIYI